MINQNGRKALCFMVKSHILNLEKIMLGWNSDFMNKRETKNEQMFFHVWYVD